MTPIEFRLFYGGMLAGFILGLIFMGHLWAYYSKGKGDKK
jgi:hypothetical protein